MGRDEDDESAAKTLAVANDAASTSYTAVYTRHTPLRSSVGGEDILDALEEAHSKDGTESKRGYNKDYPR